MLNLCALASGSSGNAIFVESQKTKVLIDAGISARELARRLLCLGVEPQDLSGILITHEHRDHIKGLRVFTKKYNVPVYSTTDTWCYLAGQDISEQRKNTIHRNETFAIGDLLVEAFPIPHDAVDPVGYTIMNANAKIGIATDLGHIPEYLLHKLKEAQLVFLEANHDIGTLNNGTYPYFLKRRILGSRGHLSNDTAADFIVQLAEEKLKKIILGHLSRNNNSPEMAVSAVRKRLENASRKVAHVTLHCCRHGELGDLISV